MRPSLKGCLDFLTSDESPPLKRTLTEEYIILRRVDIRKDNVYVEFVDGDVRDEKEWFEGPIPEYMTIGALFEMRDERDRGARREVYGRTKLLDEVGDEVLTGKECEVEASQKPSIEDEMIAMNAVELAHIKGDSSKDTDKYEVDGSSSARSRSSADTRKGPSRALSAKRTKTCSNKGDGILRSVEEMNAQIVGGAIKTKTAGMDVPKPKFRKMETRSATNNSVDRS